MEEKGKTLAEVFETISNMYNEQVEEANEKGFADVYKRSTELFIDKMKEEGITIIDVDYQDGYFIFGTGTNSVVHFHIKECPKWKFGIWYKAEEDSELKSTLIVGSLFAQHEDYIDKFKPSHSNFNETFKVRFNDEYPSGIILDDYDDDSVEMIHYIKRYPNLAFYYHMSYWDKYKYVSRLQAWKYRMSFILREKSEQHRGKVYVRKITRWFNKQAKKFVKKYPECSYGIQDCGDNISPRYDPYIVFPADFDFEDKENQCYKDFETLDKKYKEFEDKIDNKHQHNLWHSFSSYISETVEVKNENN